MKVLFVVEPLLLGSSYRRCQNAGNVDSIYKSNYCKNIFLLLKCDLTIVFLCFQAQIAFLQGERKGQENLKKDLVRRIKMLEYALKQERSVLYHPLLLQPTHNTHKYLN